MLLKIVRCHQISLQSSYCVLSFIINKAKNVFSYYYDFPCYEPSKYMGRLKTLHPFVTQLIFIRSFSH